MDHRSAGVSWEAGDETRTRDPKLGKLVLYQLSYTRIGSKLSDDQSRPSGYIESGAETPTRSRPVFTRVAVASHSLRRKTCTSIAGSGAFLIGQSW